MAKAVDIVIVEDRPVVQQRLTDLFAQHADFKLRALCSVAEEVLPRLEQNPCDLMVVDLELPGMNGEALIPLVREKYPHIKLVVFTVFEDQARIVRLLRLGVNGYLLKDTSDELLIAELKVILLGGAPLSPRVARKILDDERDQVNPQTSPLSERETEILNLIALGMSYRSIADDLEISPNTVRVHIANIYEKLATSCKVEALNRARQLGIIS
ncbi:MAG: response regulator transcription factor [Spirochaetes bacterium]|nr:response regulator transcription factor [Spirochaetota bacterium]MBX3723604.1 response regulator transcription factor [Turneriella sp.]